MPMRAVSNPPSGYHDHMDESELRTHLRAADGRIPGGPHSLTARVIAWCWPGGPDDRSDRVALEWVRRWRPEKSGARLPLCSCETGRCAVCN
jgi:hypothetical protein